MTSLLLALALHGAAEVPQCRDVHLRASYLAESKAGQGAGFYLTITNDRKDPVAIPLPAPLSVHWYAATPGGRWLWRASGGDGGSLVNALAEKGPLFAATELPGTTSAPQVIAPHQSYSWSVFSGDTPALRYRPGCQHCTYQGERQFRAVVAYAYLPTGTDADANLLRCGLRSEPVVMPLLPQESPAIQHNSGLQ